MIFSSAINYIDKWHWDCPVGLRSCPLVVRFMCLISGRCSVHLRCIRSVSVSRTVSSVHLYLCVSSPLASGTRPLHLRFVRSTSGSCPVVTRVYRTPTKPQRTATEDVTDENRTEWTPTDTLSTCNGNLIPFCPVKSFEHAQNLPTDRTDTNGHHRTSKVFTRRVTGD